MMHHAYKYVAAASGALLVASCLQTRVAFATTGDITEEFTLGIVACDDQAIGQLVDVDQDGNFETQVVIETDEGQGEILPDGTGSYKRYYFYPNGDDCTAGPEQVGRVVIRFVDATAPGWVPNLPNTWTFTNIPAVSLKAFFNQAECNPDPYLQVRAYRGIEQTDEITGTGNGFVHEFSDPIGIQEIYVRTDYCENYLDDFILYDSEQNFGGAAPDPEVIVLMDTSGSMKRDHNGTPNVPVAEQRITLARNAVEPFLTMLRDHYEGLATFGVAAFPDNQGFNYCSGYQARGLDIVSGFSIDDAIANTLPGLPVMGSTPLLGGIDTALSMFATANDKAIVLLSDGYHNCPNPVAVDDPSVANLVTAMNADAVSLHAIGFGLPSDIDHPLLETLSQQTSGQFHDVTGAGFDPATFNPAVTLQETYKTIAVDTLGLQSIVDPIETIAAGSKHSHSIKLNALDDKVTFFLSWETPAARQLQFSLYTSRGERVPFAGQGIAYSAGDNWQLLTLDDTYLRGRVGSKPWTMVVTAGKFGGKDHETYQYSVVGQSGLEFKPIVYAPDYAPGAELTLIAQLTADGKPLGGLAGLAVEVLTPAVIDGVVQKRESKQLVLRDDGRGGDARARDGIYTARYATSSNAGTYTFNFTADGVVGKTPFERYLRMHKTLRATKLEAPEKIEYVGK